MSSTQIPSVVNNYNIYNGGNVLVGISGEVELPDLEAMTETLSGSGILGEIEEAITGRYGSMKITIPFAVLYEDMFNLLDLSESLELTLRGSIQVIDKTNAQAGYIPVRIVLRGKSNTAKLGKIAQGAKGEPSVEIELTYIKVEVNGLEKIELDKLNYVYKVNGTDQMKQIKEQC